MLGIDTRILTVFYVCRKRNIKLNPSKLQFGKKVKFGGMMIEASRAAGKTQDTIYISPEQHKIDDFLDICTPTSKKEVQMVLSPMNIEKISF